MQPWSGFRTDGHRHDNMQGWDAGTAELVAHLDRA
jgi:hypothetical protein